MHQIATGIVILTCAFLLVEPRKESVGKTWPNTKEWRIVRTYPNLKECDNARHVYSGKSDLELVGWKSKFPEYLLCVPAEAAYHVPG